MGPQSRGFHFSSLPSCVSFVGACSTTSFGSGFTATLLANFTPATIYERFCAISVVFPKFPCVFFAKRFSVPCFEGASKALIATPSHFDNTFPACEFSEITFLASFGFTSTDGANTFSDTSKASLSHIFISVEHLRLNNYQIQHAENVLQFVAPHAGPAGEIILHMPFAHELPCELCDGVT